MLVSTMVTVLGLAFVIGILSHSFQRQLMNELKKEAVHRRQTEEHPRAHQQS